MRAKKKSLWFEKLALKATKVTGSGGAFIIACLLIFGWILVGPFFNYTGIWLLVISIVPSVVTLLMVFLIQKTQNKDSISIQIKLNELVASNENASNRIISIEDLSEHELVRLNEHYTRLAELTKKEKDLKSTHSIEDSILKEEKENLNRQIKSIIS